MQIRTLRNGTPDQKKEMLAAIPEDKLEDRGDRFAAAASQSVDGRWLVPTLRRKLLLANTPQQVVVLRSGGGEAVSRHLSNRQLAEELVDFWFNHFNVFLDKGADRFLIPSYEREAIRPHVLGHFRDLLEATATSPAMLFYLDNWQSVAPDMVRRRRRATVRSAG